MRNNLWIRNSKQRFIRYINMSKYSERLKKKTLKRKNLIFSICFVFGLGVISWRNSVDLSPTNRSLKILNNDKDNSKSKIGYAIDTPGCKIPLLDPFDPSLRSYMENYTNYDFKCNASQLYYMDGNVLKENSVEMEKLDNVSCGILPIYQTDKIVTYDYPVREINGSTLIEDEFITVMCNKSNAVIYQDFFAIIVKKPDVERRCEEALAREVPKNGRRLSVLLLLIDSASRNHYIRHLSRTDEFIRKHLTYIELHGYNKVGISTFGNMLPFFTGSQESDYGGLLVRLKLDFLPFVWKEFANSGYRTLFGQDQGFPMFNMEWKGFVNRQTDFYLRLFSVAANDDKNLRQELKFGCFHNRTESSVILQWVREFFDKFKEDPLFAVIYLSKLSHDNYNTVAFYDQSLLEFFTTFVANGHLNNTIVAFFGDHGFHVGIERLTYVGHVEEKLPFMFLLLPPWFSRQYPELYHNAKLNEHRLVTPFDMHATLLDILNNLVRVKKNSSVRNRSVSLFTPISEDRTCHHANIHTIFCSCSERQSISNISDSATHSGRLLVSYINEQTENYRLQCHHLSLSEIIDVSIQTISTDIGQYNESYVTIYQLIVKVVPSRAIFQGVVRYGHNSRVDPIIDRLNPYGNQSHCISDARLKIFCYCYDIAN